MNYIRKYCFTCKKSYEVHENHPHICVMEDARREFTLDEVRTVIREVASSFFLRPPEIVSVPVLYPSDIRKACDGDLGV